MNEVKFTEKGLQQLQDFFQNTEIPVINRNYKAFITQVWTGNQEKFVSDLYAFFFKPDEIHGFKDLFLQVLLDLIRQYGKDINFDTTDMVVEREVAVKDDESEKKGRIDILLTANNFKIVIENKIWHRLDNIIDLYLKHTASQLAVVLSIEPVNVEQKYKENTVNITHQQFCNQVLKFIGDYYSEAEPFYVLLLQQFCKTLINLKMTMDKSVLDFFIANFDSIQSVLKLDTEIREYINQQAELVKRKLEEYELNVSPKVNLHPETRDYYFFLKSARNSNLMFTVILSVARKEWLLVIELHNELAEKRDDLAEKYDQIYNKYDLEKTKWSERSRKHLATKRYVLKNEVFYRLADEIVEKLRNDGFLELLKSIEDDVVLQ